MPGANKTQTTKNQKKMLAVILAFGLVTPLPSAVIPSLASPVVCVQGKRRSGGMKVRDRLYYLLFVYLDMFVI